jgi:hypothetical protein
VGSYSGLLVKHITEEAADAKPLTKLPSTPDAIAGNHFKISALLILPSHDNAPPDYVALSKFLTQPSLVEEWLPN